MSHSLLALPITLLLCTGALALDAHPKGNAATDDEASSQEWAQKQRRRDGMREALKLPVEAGPATTRQLTAQEKAELRQQLRQQRLELLK